MSDQVEFLMQLGSEFLNSFKCIGVLRLVYSSIFDDISVPLKNYVANFSKLY